MSSPQQTVERALAAARGETIVIADENSTANLRWAGNTLTTNGVAGRSRAAHRHRRRERLRGRGVRCPGCATTRSRTWSRAAAEQAAADGTPAEDTAELTEAGA